MGKNENKTKGKSEECKYEIHQIDFLIHTNMNIILNVYANSIYFFLDLFINLFIYELIYLLQ